MIDREEFQLAPIDFVEHPQMFLRVHQKGRARIARKLGRILGVLLILHVRDRTHLFGRAVADNEAAAFVRKLAFGLCDNRVQARARDSGFVHRAFLPPFLQRRFRPLR